ncbi:MAG TPA: hypothetical protein PLD10_24990 [Rhodopila sp.]|nr:hypothetical protein [Rhodopila sp.]
MRPGFVVGLTAEARIAAQGGYLARAGGGLPAGAAQAALELLDDGADGLISFGLAGGLDPALRPGTIIIPAAVLADGARCAADPTLSRRFGVTTPHLLLAGSAVVSGKAEKAALHHATGAHAVDLESGAVAQVAAQRGVPFAVIRAICDPAERTLPPAALVALDAKGGVGPLRVLASVLRQPSQIPDLLRLARDAAAARAALVRVVARASAAES